MENFFNNWSRDGESGCRNPNGSILGISSDIISFCLLVMMGFSFLAPFITGCERPDNMPVAIEIEEYMDTTNMGRKGVTVSLLQQDSFCDSLDCFIYDSRTGLLETTCCIGPYGSKVDVELLPGDKTVVSLANIWWEYDIQALENYDSMEYLRFFLEDDSVNAPLCSGRQEIAVCDSCEVAVKASRVGVLVNMRSVTNNMSDYVILENPRIRITNASLDVEALRFDGFRLWETGGVTEWVVLPCDVGLFTQYPGVSVICYPNDPVEFSDAEPASVLEFECLIRGERCVFSTQLPALHRGGEVNVDLTVDAPGACSWNIF